MRASGLGQCSLDYIASVDGYPVEDTKLEAAEMTVQGGGPVATALVSLARLGVGTSFMGIVADDGAGRAIRRGLSAEGVGVRGLLTRKGGRSQTAFIIVNRRTGTRTIIWQRPTVGALGPADVRPRVIKKSGILLLDGLMPEASMEAARLARSFDVPVLLDAGRPRPGIFDLISLSDHVVCSEEFSRGLGLTPRQTLKKLSSFGPACAVVTLGKKGSVTWCAGRVFSRPAFKVRAVDTTGAGDVFHGGYAYGVLKGWKMEKTVSFASAFAALKCLTPGGRAGIPTLARTLGFMKNPLMD
ncbi:MAG: PfkB family carbohydrate kinase [Thermodesulfobacteriota bacterium]